ncbi:rhomboid family intramembrane serine protease [Synechocystis sp. PCC 7339]|uniref:rhomboid family intramembrane serine protease n=1 Tax=unclassified Synechocystis TaxID=2640012 RepID=UPI001BB09401|nr:MULTISPECIES: rhomboid family intramembrane serine protease [unclassified Synechocystis]QUS60724.1 rhomboid family intramembrane serine protease [Synechocystis sp. PCC 7338]UAJ72910.1 rhomboid family intramembrane serine protease [Synechocystis sp. PCC 7339]
MSQSPQTPLRATLQSQFSIIVSFLAVFWLLEILDAFVFRGSLDQFGIYPRSLEGLRGILFAPFLHADFGHLIANSVPFVILAWLVMLQEVSDFWIVTVITMLVGGLGVWLIAPPNTVTVGASILIFGYLGFLLLRGWFQKNLASIVLSIIVLVLYGSALWGLLPGRPGVSWQGHLFGFIGGAIAAWLIAREKHYYGKN